MVHVLNKDTTTGEMELNVALLIRQTLGQAPEKMFWYCQFGFWVFICLVSFGTLNLWFEQYQLSYFLHVIFQAVIGLILSIFLQKAFIVIWHKSNRFRIYTGLLLIFLVAIVWTIARMGLFNLLTDEGDTWWNFGGWYFSGIFIYLCWTAMFHGLMYYQLLQREHQILLDSQHQIEEEYGKRIAAQTLARDAQLKMLRYQLSPHFLSNALNSVNALIDIGEGQLAQKTVINLSKFLRYLLDHDPEVLVTVKEEVKALMLYLDIEKIRFGERLSIELDIDEKVERGLVPSLLFQPIVENSIKHAISKREHGGTVRVSVHLQNNHINITLADSGARLEQYSDLSAEQQNRNIGMQNTISRLETMYAEKYKIAYELTANGSTTQILLPFELGNTA